MLARHSSPTGLHRSYHSQAIHQNPIEHGITPRILSDASVSTSRHNQTSRPQCGNAMAQLEMPSHRRQQSRSGTPLLHRIQNLQPPPDDLQTRHRQQNHRHRHTTHLQNRRRLRASRPERYIGRAETLPHCVHTSLPRHVGHGQAGDIDVDQRLRL